MENRFDRKERQPLCGRLFVGLCLFSALAFTAGCLFFFAPPLTFAASDSVLQAVAPFFRPSDSAASFAFFVFGELKFLLLILFSGLTSAAPMLAFAVPAARAFAAGFAACGLLALDFGRFPFLIFTIFFAFTLVIEAHASSLACLFALFRQNGEPDVQRPASYDRLSYLVSFLTPVGLTMLLSLAKEGLLRLP